MFKKVLAVFLISGLCFTGCGASEGIVGDIVNDYLSESNPPRVGSYRFVDALGVSHHASIDPNMDPKPYLDGGFIKQGQNLTYSDGFHESRLGIDVSSHQGPIDWQAVKDAGYEFAIIRIGYRGYSEEGQLKEDETSRANIAGAKAAGMDVGVYFFSQAINELEAEEEANFVLALLDGEELPLGICYDPESILDDEARTDEVTGEQFTVNTQVFCSLVEEAGYSPMVYSNLLWQAYKFDMGTLVDKTIWYADYNDVPQTPYRFEFWQYSESGSVPGVEGPVDLDIQIMLKPGVEIEVPGEGSENVENTEENEIST